MADLGSSMGQALVSVGGSPPMQQAPLLTPILRSDRPSSLLLLPDFTQLVLTSWLWSIIQGCQPSWIPLLFSFYFPLHLKSTWWSLTTKLARAIGHFTWEMNRTLISALSALERNGEDTRFKNILGVWNVDFICFLSDLFLWRKKKKKIPPARLAEGECNGRKMPSPPTPTPGPELHPDVFFTSYQESSLSLWALCLNFLIWEMEIYSPFILSPP